MARKTIELEALVNYCNGFLSAKGGTKDSRYGVISVLEAALFKSVSYKGFLYLGQEEVDDNDKPGIRYIMDENGMTGDTTFDDTDSTRRKYIL